MLPEASLTFYGPAAAWGAQIKALRPARRAGQIKTPIVLSGCPTGVLVVPGAYDVA